MTELLPNLDALAALLAGGAGSRADALALVEAARDASNVEELDVAIRTVVEGWRGE